jgi:2-oxo-4-hydroxy-4-carboxy-5-ureidoimidazoline decarboxylase
MTLNDLNRLDDEQAIATLLRCCGSSRWARLMTSSRPFVDVSAMTDAADWIWASLGASDYREAFAAHPKIGSSSPGGSGAADSWPDHEQAGVRSASVGVRQRLAEANREYEARFGYIFIVCATGKTAAEMLALLEVRLHHPPDEELAIAAGEQRKITRLRLHKLLADTHVTTP